MRNDPAWLAGYLGGLRALKREIAEKLEKAGAKLGPECVTHPKLAEAEESPPSRLTITVVPFNAPRLMADFSAEDVLRSTPVVHAGAAARIEQLVAGFRSYREDPVRYLDAAESRSPRMQRRKATAPANGDHPGAAGSATKSHDRHRIDINMAHEVRYWMSVLGVDMRTLVEAVEAVGPSAQSVRRHLKEGKHHA